MFFQLRKKDYLRVEALFKNVDFNLIISAVISGLSPGKIFVDDTKNPKTAFMVSAEGFHLVGNHKNSKFNKALQQYIKEVVYPEGVASKEDGFCLHYDPIDWEKPIETIILKNKHPLKYTRRHCTHKERKIEWKSKIPECYEIRQVDNEILRKRSFGNITEITEWIKSNWNSRSEFLEKGFGFLVIHDKTIASWCIADCVVGGKCEIGIHTDPDYRRLGLGSLVIAATIDYCLENNINEIGWHCWQSSIASREIAHKLGFEHELNYPVYDVWFDEFDNLVENGWYYLHKTDLYLEAAKYFEEAFKLKVSMKDYRIRKAHNWHYYWAACSWALAGDKNAAIRNVSKAVARGWTDLEHLEKSKALASLHPMKEWKTLIRKLKKVQEDYPEV